MSVETANDRIALPPRAAPAVEVRRGRMPVVTKGNTSSLNDAHHMSSTRH